MHYTFFIKEHQRLKVKCGKSQSVKTYIDRNSQETWSGIKTVVFSMFGSASFPRRG